MSESDDKTARRRAAANAIAYDAVTRIEEAFPAECRGVLVAVAFADDLTVIVGGAPGADSPDANQAIEHDLPAAIGRWARAMRAAKARLRLLDFEGEFAVRIFGEPEPNGPALSAITGPRPEATFGTEADAAAWCVGRWPNAHVHLTSQCGVNLAVLFRDEDHAPIASVNAKDPEHRFNLALWDSAPERSLH